MMMASLSLSLALCAMAPTHVFLPLFTGIFESIASGSDLHKIRKKGTAEENQFKMNCQTVFFCLNYELVICVLNAVFRSVTGTEASNSNERLILEVMHICLLSTLCSLFPANANAS